MKKTYFIPATEEVKVMGESPLMGNQPGLPSTSGGLWGAQAPKQYNNDHKQ